MPIKAASLIAQCLIPLTEGWGYIWGSYGQVHTQAAQNSATREQTRKWGQRWVGKRVVDCSGLLYWAFKELGGYIYHGSNTMFNKYCTATGKIAPGVRIKPGTAVFLWASSTKYHHVGLYIGGGQVVESKGTYYGVVKSNVADWDYWGELKGVDYTDAAPEEIAAKKPTLRQGSQGESVKLMQKLLGAHGYAVTPDGTFGEATKTVVQNFQRAKGLDPDGVCGPLTWAALTSVPDDQPAPEGDDDKGDAPDPAWAELIQQMHDALTESTTLNARMGQMVEALNLMLMEVKKDDMG